MLTVNDCRYANQIIWIKGLGEQIKNCHNGKLAISKHLVDSDVIMNIIEPSSLSIVQSFETITHSGSFNVLILYQPFLFYSINQRDDSGPSLVPDRKKPSFYHQATRLLKSCLFGHINRNMGDAMTTHLISNMPKIYGVGTVWGRFTTDKNRIPTRTYLSKGHTCLCMLFVCL